MWAAMREKRRRRRNGQNWQALSAEFDAAVAAAGERERQALAAQIFRELLPTVPDRALTADGREALNQARTRPEVAEALGFRQLADRVESGFGQEVPAEYSGVVDALHSWADHLLEEDPRSLATLAVDHLLRFGGGATAGLGRVDPQAPDVRAKAEHLLTILRRR